LTEVSCKRLNNTKSQRRQSTKTSIKHKQVLSIIESTATPLKKGYQWTMTKIYLRWLKAKYLKIGCFITFQSFSTDAFNWQLKLRRQGWRIKEKHHQQKVILLKSTIVLYTFCKPLNLYINNRWDPTGWLSFYAIIDHFVVDLQIIHTWKFITFDKF